MHTGNQADCKKLFALMNLGVKYETPIKITVSGNDEVIAAEKMKEIIKESL
jgi:phosphotransferase system HPr-like phosphotransfer protein